MWYHMYELKTCYVLFGKSTTWQHYGYKIKIKYQFNKNNNFVSSHNRSHILVWVKKKLLTNKVSESSQKRAVSENGCYPKTTEIFQANFIVVKSWYLICLLSGSLPFRVWLIVNEVIPDLLLLSRGLFHMLYCFRI